MVYRHRLVLLGALLALFLAALIALGWQGGDSMGGIADAGGIDVVRDDGGLQLAMSVPRGPYFLHELLPVTLTLANYTGRPIAYAGSSLLPARCSASTFDVTMTSRGHDLDPLAPLWPGPIPHCPIIRWTSHALPPGRSLRVQMLLRLPVGGRITLTAGALFPPGVRVLTPGLLDPGGPLDALRRVWPGLFRSSHRSFASGWPSLTLPVASRIPAGRVLHLVRRDHTVRLQEDPRRLPPLVAQQMVAAQTGQWTCLAGGAGWTPLAGGTLSDAATAAGCGTDHEKWQVLVGAPGYAVASAVYCFNPTPGMLFGTRGVAPWPPALRCTEITRDN